MMAALIAMAAGAMGGGSAIEHPHPRPERHVHPKFREPGPRKRSRRPHGQFPTRQPEGYYWQPVAWNHVHPRHKRAT